MRAVFSVLGLVLYPIAVHLLIMAEAPRAAVLGLVTVSLLYLLVLGRKSLAGAKAGRPGGYSPWLAMYGLLVLVGVVNLLTHSVYALFLPPVFINLGLMLFFAGSLRAGSLPLVERLMQLAYSRELPLPIRILARRLTWIWVLFFGVMALLGVALALYAPLPIWSLCVNVLYYLLVVVLFLTQHVYRDLRYRRYGAVSLGNIVRNVVAGSRRPAVRKAAGNTADATEICPK
ncbi:MAG: COG4648 family protein [Acidiferrobacterales bacterium]